MPDLITHMAVSHLLRKPWERMGLTSPSTAFRTIFYLGTILPDVLTRPFFILFPKTHDLVIIFHTPAGFLTISVLFSLLFAERIRNQILINLVAGGGLHFLLDSIQKQVIDNDFWLFPLSWQTFGYEMVWPHEFMNYLPVTAVLVLFMELFVYFRDRNRKKIT